MAPADGEDRLPDSQGPSSYLQLEMIPLGIDTPHVGDRVFPVHLGIDVPTTSKDQAIHHLKELLHVDRERGREDDRCAPGSLDRVDIRVGDPMTVVIPAVGGCYSYKGSHINLVKGDLSVYVFLDDNI